MKTAGIVKVENGYIVAIGGKSYICASFSQACERVRYHFDSVPDKTRLDEMIDANIKTFQRQMDEDREEI